jgi:hypothetical protein
MSARRSSSGHTHLRILYPTDDIVVHANDVKSCIHQIKHHSNVARAFSYIIADYLFFQAGLAFSTDFSPANWEAVRFVQSALTKRLFSDTSLFAKHCVILDKTTWCCSLRGHHKPCFTRAIGDALHPGILDDLGNPVSTPHGIYINDDIYLDVADTHHFKQAIAASIEAIFILLGESNTALRQDPISWDKLHKLLVALTNRILGLVLDLRSMTVGTPPEFTSATINLLGTTWGPPCCTFKV